MSMLTRDKYMTADEQKLLKRLLKSDRNSLLIRLALETGGRANEILAVKRADISNGSVSIRGSKGSHARDIPISSTLEAQLLGLIPSTDGRLFPISYVRLHQIWQEYRPVSKKFHSLRHTFAVNLYQRTKDIRLVQHALGHRSINNTLIYAVVLDAQDKLKAALLAG